MLEIHRLGHARNLVELPQIVRQVRVIDGSPKVALEMPGVDRIEADEGDEQAPVRLGAPISGRVGCFDNTPTQ